MRITFDRSAETGILIRCSSCEYWFSYRFDQCEAYDSGAAHARRAHDDVEESERLQKRASDWRSRNAEEAVEHSPHGTL